MECSLLLCHAPKPLVDVPSLQAESKNPQINLLPLQAAELQPAAVIMAIYKLTT